MIIWNGTGRSWREMDCFFYPLNLGATTKFQKWNSIKDVGELFSISIVCYWGRKVKGQCASVIALFKKTSTICVQAKVSVLVQTKLQWVMSNGGAGGGGSDFQWRCSWMTLGWTLLPFKFADLTFVTKPKISKSMTCISIRRWNMGGGLLIMVVTTCRLPTWAQNVGPTDSLGALSGPALF